MLHKREYEIVNAGIVTNAESVKMLQVSMLVTDHLGIRHDEYGKEITRKKTQSFGMAILFSELPSTNKEAYVMNNLKTAYKQMKTEEKEAKVFVGYKTTENVS